MFAAPDLLILITSRMAACATVRAGQVQAFAELPRDAAADLVTAVESALDLGDPAARRIWIATSEAWSQPITIQADVARRVPPDQLPHFACFEVEPFSGISPSQALAGVSPLPRSGPDPAYWVTEVELNTLEQIDGIIRARGKRLAGLVHLAGANRWLGATGPAGAWNRLELWPDVAVCLAQRGHRDCRRQLFARGGAQEWVAQAEAWFAQQGPAPAQELWNVAGEFEVPAGFSPPEWPSRSPEFDGLQDWAAAWGAALAERPDVPVLNPPAPPMTARAKRFITAGLAAAALLVCVAHYQITSWMNNSAANALNQPIAELTGPTQLATALRKANSEQTKALAELTEKEQALATELARFRHAAASQRQRIPELLAALSDACEPAVLVHKVENQGGELRVFGRCLDTRQANRVVQSLAGRLSPLGLTVSPPDKNATYRLQDGGPHEFEFVISDNSGQ